MVFLQLLHHALAAAAKPSLTNPFALAAALSGVAMAVAMIVAARSFTRLEREEAERAERARGRAGRESGKAA